VLRSADLILIIVEVLHPEHYAALLKELNDAGIRINTRQPDVRIIKRMKDGIRISKTVKFTKINEETIFSILRAFRISNADVLIRSDVSDDEFIDCIEGNRKYVPAICVVNKIDMVSVEEGKRVGKAVNADLLVSAEKKEHLEELRDLIFNKLGLIRIYMKEPGKDADLNVPLIIFRGSTVRDVCSKLHKDFVKLFKFCRVWGGSAKFPGQKLSLKHVMLDGDVLEVHLR
jgi:ribosome-interacting GTPase 1